MGDTSPNHTTSSNSEYRHPHSTARVLRTLWASWYPIGYWDPCKDPKKSNFSQKVFFGTYRPPNFEFYIADLPAGLPTPRAS